MTSMIKILVLTSWVFPSVFADQIDAINPTEETAGADPVIIAALADESHMHDIGSDYVKNVFGDDLEIGSISWQAALVGAAVFIVPWTLFFTTLFRRSLSNKNTPPKEKEETASKEKNTPTKSNSKKKESESVKTPELKNDNNPPRDVDDEINAEPFHLHAMRIPDARLLGAQRNLSFSSRNSSRSSSRSRSRSSSPATSKTRSSTFVQDIADNLSDISDKDADILTDNLGLQDIEPINHDSHVTKTNSLPPVNERMSEENLDDCHAFSDISRNGSSHGKTKRHSLPPLNERISKETLDDCDAFKQVTVPERRSSMGRSNSFTGAAINESDISCNNSILETFEEEEEDELDEDDDEEMKKQQISHDVLFELLGTVSSPKEKKELKIVEERSRRLSFSSTLSPSKPK